MGSCRIKIHTILLLCLSIFELIKDVSSNGRFLEPPCRSSIWRFAEFKKYNPPQNYNDNHLDCGGALVDNDFTNCGICGDSVSDPVPRGNEDGGAFAKGIIVRTYKKEQEIPITVQLTTGQKGFFEFKLCAKDDAVSHLNPLCYLENPLNIVGAGKQFKVTESPGKYYNLTLQLPPKITCNQCVLRWRYKTGNNWGECGNGKQGQLGCGPQTTFYGCSDIAII